MAIVKDDMRWAWDVHWLTREDLRWSVRRLVERGESTDYLADACQVSPETAAEWMDEMAGRRALRGLRERVPEGGLLLVQAPAEDDAE